MTIELAEESMTVPCQPWAIHRAIYSDLPEEIQLLWYKDLPR
jgi:hypothetical protein